MDDLEANILADAKKLSGFKALSVAEAKIVGKNYPYQHIGINNDEFDRSAHTPLQFRVITVVTYFLCAIVGCRSLVFIVYFISVYCATFIWMSNSSALGLAGLYIFATMVAALFVLVFFLPFFVCYEIAELAAKLFSFAVLEIGFRNDWDVIEYQWLEEDLADVQIDPPERQRVAPEKPSSGFWRGILLGLGIGYLFWNQSDDN